MQTNNFQSNNLQLPWLHQDSLGIWYVCHKITGNYHFSLESKDMLRIMLQRSCQQRSTPDRDWTRQDYSLDLEFLHCVHGIWKNTKTWTKKKYVSVRLIVSKIRFVGDVCAFMVDWMIDILAIREAQQLHSHTSNIFSIRPKSS
jgi:hypothetical protein